MISNAFRYNAGLIRANGTPFFTGDGLTDSATLLDRHGNPISSGKLKRVDAIHRTDWQGRQLLYPTARTQICTKTEAFSTWAGYFLLPPSLRSGDTGPDGTASAWSFEFGDGALGSAGRCGMRPDDTAAASLTAQSRVAVWAKADEPLQISIGCLQNGFPQVALNLTTSWAYYTGTPPIAGQVTQRNFVLALNSSLAINAGKSASSRIYFAFPQFTQDAELGTYIRNTGTTARTLTDYTLSGSAVNFGETPANDAVCDWTGVARR